MLFVGGGVQQQRSLRGTGENLRTTHVRPKIRWKLRTVFALVVNAKYLDRAVPR